MQADLGELTHNCYKTDSWLTLTWDYQMLLPIVHCIPFMDAPLRRSSPSAKMTGRKFIISSSLCSQIWTAMGSTEMARSTFEWPTSSVGVSNFWHICVFFCLSVTFDGNLKCHKIVLWLGNSVILKPDGLRYWLFSVRYVFGIRHIVNCITA